MEYPIEVLLPAHNESETIAQTLQEFHQVVAEQDGLSIQLLVSEDGSVDNTVDEILRVAARYPVKLLSEPVRKGYSRAVIDGFKATKSPLVSFIDSDGQCDPRDFKTLYQELITSGCDMVVGFRNPRRDSWIRLLMSKAFNQFYRLFFNVGLKDR